MVGRTNLRIFQISCPQGNVINTVMLVLTMTINALCLLITSYVPKENTSFPKVQSKKWPPKKHSFDTREDPDWRG